MKLRSNLSVLLELDLSALLAVQRDVTHLIEAKVDALQYKRSKSLLNSSFISKQAQPNFEQSADKENIEVTEKVSIEAGESDSDDYILTQFDHRHREKLLRQNSNEASITAMPKDVQIHKKSDLSSPLKESQALADSLSSFDEDALPDFGGSSIRELNMNVTRAKVPHSTKKIRKYKGSPGNSPSKLPNSRLLRLEPPKKKALEYVNLSVNPLNKRPWILEDFKRNDDVDSIKRGRKKMKTLKLHRFYADGGPPPDSKNFDHQNAQISEDELYNDNNDYEFDNLRTRSKSPPGFGRLDFPSTQERFDDKQKSQEIIFRKTKKRFILATCNSIPPQERAYVFKSDKLNRLVDNGTFEWSEKELKIFSRK